MRIAYTLPLVPLGIALLIAITQAQTDSNPGAISERPQATEKPTEIGNPQTDKTSALDTPKTSASDAPKTSASDAPKTSASAVHKTSKPNRRRKPSKKKCNHQRIRSFIASPPPGWGINSMNKRDVNDFICNEVLVNGAISCIEDPLLPACVAVKGLFPLVDDIVGQINEDYSCPTCSRQTTKLLLDAVRFVQNRYPKIYSRGLASLF